MTKVNDRSLANILPQTGKLTPTGWRLPQQMSQGQWIEAGNALSRVEGAINWWIGDWWTYGQHAYGDRKALVNGEDWTGPSYQGCKDAAMVAAAFERSRRRDLLPFGFHREVISLPAEFADKILDWCEEGLSANGKLPTRAVLREEVRKAKAFLAAGWNPSQLERKSEVERSFTVVASKRVVDEGKGLPVDDALINWADGSNVMVPIDRGTAWGNPFELGKDGTREEVIRKYREYYLPHKDSLQNRLGELKGKVLVCWCHPEPCHGHVLQEIANNEN